MPRDVAIVGAGMTGLSLALRLAEGGARVTVYDAAPALGGLSVATALPGFCWDRFYHVIAGGDRPLLELLTAIGLADEVRWSTARQGIYLDGAVRSLVSPMDLLALPGLSLLDKFRLGLLALRGHRPRPDRELDETTAADWLRRRCGRRGYEVFWRPLLRSKLGDAATTTAARFIHATLVRLQMARGSGHTEQFGYVQGGYRRILDRLTDRLTERGVTLRPATAVTAIAADAARDDVVVRTAAGDHRHGQAVATLPNPQLATLLHDLAPGDRARLLATPYLGVACTIAVGRAPLSGRYILNLADETLAVTGVIEMTAVVDRAQTNGHTLVYLPRYAVSSSPLFEQGDDELRARALEDLHRVFPQTRDDWLLHSEVHRARLIQPIQLAGAAPHAPPREVVPGRVYCVTNAQLPPGALNNSDCVALATTAADALLATARGPAPATARG